MASAGPSDAGGGPPPPPPTPEGPNFGPGIYEELHKRCKDVFPINFEGAKLMVNKGLSNVFQISHTLSLNPQANSYRFGATYVGAKQIGPNEAYPVLLADTDLAGNMTATMIHSWSPRTRQKFQLQLAKREIQGAQLSTEYRGRLHSACLTFANTDLVKESGIIVGQYLRRIHPRLDLGLELVYQHSRQIPGGQFSSLSYAARYSGENWIASAAVGRTSLNACYFHKHSPELEMAVEWETNFRMQESHAQIAYHAQVPKADLSFKASLDTDWTVGAVLEKRLPPMPFTLALSGLLNHTKGSSKFGLGLIIGN